MKTKEKTDFRVCRDCKDTKHKDLFVRNHVFSDGIDTLCRECNHRRVREWRAKGNRKTREEAARYRERYPEKVNKRAALRNARVRVATPKWLSAEEIRLIRQAQALARMRSKETGYLWHIDHIVPIAGADVCGLNVPWNVRVIPAQENWRKANKAI